MELIVVLVGAIIPLAALILIREKRIAKAAAYGFVYEDNFSYNQNRRAASMLRKYAHEQADLFELTGRVEPGYASKLFSLGLSVKVVKENSPCEIADICTEICLALKC